ncbi:MAG: AIR carboxylase family protein [Patescibacteria group bacterium]|nr:AIR carboxylase family protein [Patescibacteria group bacterium]
MAHQVPIIMGSRSDEKVMKESGMLEILQKCKVTYEVSVISAHRHAARLAEYCVRKEAEGAEAFICMASMSALLPGAVASKVRGLTVIGVALVAGELDGLDALLTITRNPKGVPVAYAGMGKAGLANAALLAIQIVAKVDPEVRLAYKRYLRESLEETPAEIGIFSFEGEEE